MEGKAVSPLLLRFLQGSHMANLTQVVQQLHAERKKVQISGFGGDQYLQGFQIHSRLAVLTNRSESRARKPHQSFLFSAHTGNNIRRLCICESSASLCLSLRFLSGLQQNSRRNGVQCTKRM